MPLKLKVMMLFVLGFHARCGVAGRRAKSFSQFRGDLRDLGDPVLVGGCCGWRSPAVPGFR